MSIHRGKRCKLCDRHHSLFDDYCQRCRDDLNTVSKQIQKERVMPSDQNVYAISVAGDPAALVKFGFSCSVSTRLNSFQIGSPVKLEVVAHCRGLRHHEKMIHRYLSRERAYGEWFQRSERTLQIIEAIAAGTIVSFLEDRGARLRVIKHLQEQTAVV
jgi:hypothetical protein